MRDFAICHGLPVALRAEAAALYWSAFGAKLNRIMGPEARALAYLDRALQANHLIAALSPQGQLLGIAGFKSPQGAMADGDLADLSAAYGPVGAAWRLAALRLLRSETDNVRFLVDGISVLPEAQGQGVGSGLIEALCAEGRARGYGEIRLEVITTNPRAQALYERHGFVAIKTESLGALRLVFGFTAMTTMVKPLV